MSLQKDIMDQMKLAMKNKNTVALTALRAVKSAILLVQTESGEKKDLTEDQEIKLLQKLVKQRKDSAALYQEQNRNDLAEPELAEAEVIAQFLPAQLSVEDVEAVVKEIIVNSGASDMKAMGMVMGQASKKLAGQADGKVIAEVVKRLLSA